MLIMYNDELDMALESAYEDGYYQALADMGYEFDDEDEASEDVDIFSEDYFDEAMEGNPENKAKKNEALVRQNRIDRGARLDGPTSSGDRKLARQMNPYKTLRKDIYGKSKHEPGNRETYDRGTHYLNNDPDRDAFQGSPSARYRAYDKIKHNPRVRDLKS